MFGCDSIWPQERDVVCARLMQLPSGKVWNLRVKVSQHGERPLARLDDRLKWNQHRLGHDSSQFYGTDFGLLRSAMTNFDIPTKSRTVSVKSFVSGLSKLKTIGT